jgi:tetratricopeptide (TPR) repeat protein
VTAQDQDELMADLRRVGLDGSFAVAAMKKESFATVGIGASVLVLPPSVLMAGLQGGSFSGERLTEGLRQAVAALRRVEPTAVLAESLLSLVRASAGGEAPERRLGMVVEAIAVLRRVSQPHRLPRAYVALGNVLSEMGRFYDALAALDRAANAERDNRDAGALLAIHFGRATIFRGLGLQTEALSELHHADWALSAMGPETSDKL